MNQIRYFNAFLLSSLAFVLMYFIFLALPSAEKIIKPAPSAVIKIALIEPVKKIVKPVPVLAPIVPPIPVKKVEKKKPKKIIKKKIVKKKIIKKVKPKKVVKKVVKKKVIPKKVIRKPVETHVPPAPVYVAPPPVIYTPVETYVAPPPPVVKTYVPPAPVYVAPKPVIQQPVETYVPPTPRPSVNNAHHKKAFLENVRSKIIANKKYPKMAKRRHIEGSVKVRFDITARGHVSNIRFINGKRIFHKSIRKTLESTFPMSIPPEVLGELPISDVSVVLHFNIR